VERVEINAFIKYGGGKPYELTVKDSEDILDISA
jgi:hypothetical protein